MERSSDDDRPVIGSEALVGLLADERRLKVVAALVLGATSEEQIASASGLGDKTVRTALDRLMRGGLVSHGPSGWQVLTGRFTDAARLAAASRKPAITPEELGATSEQVPVLRNFLVDGRLTHLPASRSKRLVVLDFLAGRFEPGRVYPERDVNLMLGQFHADVASLRRALVDEEFLERREGFYWRAGGTVEVD